jgi:hypothetical protein
MAERSTAKQSGKPEAAPDGGAFAASQTHGAADAPGPGSDEVQSAMDKATDAGLFGVEIDSTPNENYTVAGVTSGAPTPETDPEHAEKVRRETGRR